MSFEVVLRYDSQPEQVLAMLTSEAALRAKLQALGHGEPQELTVLRDGDVTTITTTRDVPSDVPRLLQRVLPALNTVTQADRWQPLSPDGRAVATWDLKVHGQPVRATGRVTLSPHPEGGTQLVIVGDVTASVPVVGGKLAAFLEQRIGETLRQEQWYGIQWLAAQEHAA
jgi:hypothetical protein